MKEALLTVSTDTVLFALLGLFTFQFLTTLYLLYTLQRSASSRERINRETFGLLRKVEGLLARKQEKLTKEYDRLLEQMTLQVPILIARQAGQDIYEAEKSVLTRLAEIEPSIKDDDAALQKMETIIKTMEGLESTVINATSKAVENILVENRKDLFHREQDDESPLESLVG